MDFLLLPPGFAALLGGAYILVRGASSLALRMGVSELAVGLTVVAMGTSLPELATSALAAWRGNADLAVGNVVGSNIMNIFWILGVSAAIAPVNFNPTMNIDLLVMLVATALLFSFTYTGRRHRIDRPEGLLFIFAYVAYMLFLVLRG